MSGLEDVLLNLETAAVSSPPPVSREDATKRFVELAPTFFGHRLVARSDAVKLVTQKEENSQNDLGNDIGHYQALLERCKEQERRHKEELEESLESIRELRRVYMYGLETVSELQDLSEAPDALLPGNFVRPQGRSES
mgnify:CR=1 FL=1